MGKGSCEQHTKPPPAAGAGDFVALSNRKSTDRDCMMGGEAGSVSGLPDAGNSSDDRAHVCTKHMWQVRPSTRQTMQAWTPACTERAVAHSEALIGQALPAAARFGSADPERHSNPQATGHPAHVLCGLHVQGRRTAC